MRVLQKWARGTAVLLVVLSGTAHADVTVSQSNDPSASVDSRLTRLFGVERTAFTSITPDKLEKIITPPTTVGRSAGGYPEPKKIEYNPGWLSKLPAAKGGEQWQCLAEAVYFESRGEPVKGQFGVAEVILNRVDSARFPDTVCGVVNQGAHRRNACQFSFACDGAPEVIHNAAAYRRAGKIARLLLDGAPRKVTDGATYFHTRSVHPSWSRRFTRTATVGAHLFYRVPSRVAAK